MLTEDQREFLTEIDTDDLLKFLLNRFTHHVFVGRIDSVENLPAIGLKIRWGGDQHICCGLLQQLNATIVQTLQRKLNDG